jgi:hypothetical protein
VFDARLRTRDRDRELFELEMPGRCSRCSLDWRGTSPVHVSEPSLLFPTSNAHIVSSSIARLTQRTTSRNSGERVLIGVINSSMQDAFPSASMRRTVNLRFHPILNGCAWLAYSGGTEHLELNLIILANRTPSGVFPPEASARLLVRHRYFGCHETTQRQHASEPSTCFSHQLGKLLAALIPISYQILA